MGFMVEVWLGTNSAYLVLVDYPTPRLLILALMEPLIFHDLVHRNMCKTCCLRQLLCMCRLSHTRRARNDNVWVLARHVVGGGFGRFVAERFTVVGERTLENKSVPILLWAVFEGYPSRYQGTIKVPG